MYSQQYSTRFVCPGPILSLNLSGVKLSSISALKTKHSASKIALRHGRHSSYNSSMLGHVVDALFSRDVKSRSDWDWADFWFSMTRVDKSTRTTLLIVMNNDDKSLLFYWEMPTQPSDYLYTLTEMRLIWQIKNGSI